MVICKPLAIRILLRLDTGGSAMGRGRSFTSRQQLDIRASRPQADITNVIEGWKVAIVSVGRELHHGDMEDEFPPAAIRSPEEVARRALALFSVVGVALGAPRDDVLQWLAETGLTADLAPSEHRFLATPTPSRRQIVDGGWLSERLVVLCWALCAVNDLPPPDQQCDTGAFQDLLPPFADVTTSSFIANAKLRPDVILIGKAEELLHHHWEARNAKITGNLSNTLVDIEIVQERHHAINWVVGYGGIPWDEVTTDT